MFVAFKRLQMVGIAAQPNLAHMVHLVAVGYFALVHPVDRAVEHLHNTVTGSAVAPALAEVAISVWPVGEADYAARLKNHEAHWSGLVTPASGKPPSPNLSWLPHGTLLVA